MKIVLVSNLYPPYTRGGAEQIVYRTAQGLSTQGHEVHVVTTHPVTQTESVIEQNIHVHRINPGNIFYYANDHKYTTIIRFLWRLIDTFNIISAFRTKKILQQINPDYVITHNLVGLGLLIPRVIKGLSIPHVHVLHDVQLIVPSGHLLGERSLGVFEKCYSFITRHLFDCISAVSSPSAWLLNYHKKYSFFLDSKTSVLPNPVPTIKYLDKKALYKTDKVVITYIGQLEKHKGVELLLKLIDKLGTVDIQFVIVGDGSLASEVKTFVAERPHVNYLGKLSHEDVITQIKKSTYVIVPSICAENSPTVIYESFICGVPVIASAIGGIPELVTNKTGFLCKANDIESLHSICKQAVACDKASYQKLSQNCLDKAYEFSLDNYCKKLIDFLNTSR